MHHTPRWPGTHWLTKQAEHKIQSSHGTLSLEMDQVPKVLRPLVQEWTPEGYIVSFKVCPCLPRPYFPTFSLPPSPDTIDTPHPVLTATHGRV